MKNDRIIRLALLLLVTLAAELPSMAQTDRHDVRSGNRRFSKEKYQEAEVDYRKACIKDSLSVAGNYNLASALYREGNYEEAAKTMARIKEVAPATEHASDYHYNDGDVALQKKDYAAAVEAFKKSLLLNPGDLDAKENYIYAKKMLENSQNGGGGQDQQNQDQNKDQQNQNQDQQNQNQDQQDQQNQDNDRQDQDQQNQDQQQKLSSQQAQQMLKAVQAQEQKTQDKVNKEKAAVLKSKQKEKNW